MWHIVFAEHTHDENTDNMRASDDLPVKYLFDGFVQTGAGLAMFFQIH